MKRKFNQFRLNSSIKLGGSDSNNYTCVLENNVLKNPSTAAIQGQIWKTGDQFAFNIIILIHLIIKT